MDTLFDKEFRYVNGNLMKKNSDNLLDQYFTNKELAKSLYQKTYNFIIFGVKTINLKMRNLVGTITDIKSHLAIF